MVERNEPGASLVTFRKGLSEQVPPKVRDPGTGRSWECHQQRPTDEVASATGT